MTKGPRVIMISSDRQIFDKKSAVRARMIDYGNIFEELHIIVFSLDLQSFQQSELSKNVFVYPTNSKNKIFYIIDAVRIAIKISKKIFYGQTVLSVQDPFETGISGVLVKKITKLPLQIQIHTDLYSNFFYDGSFLNWLRFQISHFTLKYADRIRVVSSKIKNDLIHYAKIKSEKITVLPIYVDVKKIMDDSISVNLHIKYPKWGKIILVASRFEKEKNVSLAIKAFAEALPKIENIGMVIVGGGSEEGKLKLIAKNLKLEANVVFESWQQNLISYYKTADLFLNTSIFEGYGMALIEAAAAGCPILTTNVGVIQDYFKDGYNALICPVDDIECLKNKLITFFNNPSIARKLSVQASDTISKIEQSKQDYLNEYRRSFDKILSK